MKTRIISAVAGLAILAAVLFLFETLVLDIAVSVISVIAVYEMINAVGLSKNKGIAAICVMFAAFFSSESYRAFASAEGFEVFLLGITLLILALANHKKIKVTDVTFAFFFTLIIPKAFSTILLFRSYGEPISYFLVMMSLAVAWLNDTCAYFSGYFFGKRKLCPEISPKKTVEGAIGGVMGDVVVCSLLALVFTLITGYSVNWFSFVIFVPLGAILAILGDLCASIIKRQTGIKDYGNIMPGHGGIVDRFDSWIFVAPALYIWNLYFPFIG